jgi:peptide/nickel transport system substrate-binding protein
VDDLLARATMEKNLDKRKALYADFQKAVVNDVPVAFTRTSGPFASHGQLR